MTRKMILTMALSLLAVAAIAQNRPTFIVSAGYQTNSLNFTPKIEDYKMGHGMRAGAAVDFSLFRSLNMEFSLQPGLNFSLRGTKEGSDAHRYYYVDLPVLANLRFYSGDRFNAFINAGPYLAYGITANTPGVNPFATKSETFKPFDWGVQLGAGVEYNRFMLSAGTQLGLQNISNFPEATKITSSKFNGIYVTLGYRF